jgi:hypothetical protein
MLRYYGEFVLHLSIVWIIDYAIMSQISNFRRLISSNWFLLTYRNPAGTNAVRDYLPVGEIWSDIGDCALGLALAKSKP